MAANGGKSAEDDRASSSVKTHARSSSTSAKSSMDISRVSIDAPALILLDSATTPTRHLQGKELEMYHTFIRCSLRPFAHHGEMYDKSVTEYSSLSFLSDMLLAELGDPRTRRLTKEGLSTMKQRVKAYLAAEKTDNDDAVLRRALVEYNSFLKKQGAELIQRTTHVAADFLAVFSTFLLSFGGDNSIGNDSSNSGGEEESPYSQRMWRFVDVILAKAASIDMPSKRPRRTTLVPDLFHGITPSLTTHERAGNASNITVRLTPFLSANDFRALFSVDLEQHENILTIEKRAPHPETAIKELKLRILCLDDHPIYNKDTFIHKTAAFLKWKELEAEKANLLLKSLYQEYPKSDVAKASNKDDKWIARLIVTVDEIRLLLAESGLSKPKDSVDTTAYCTLKLDNEFNRTPSHVLHMTADKHPWNERFVFDLANLDGTLKIKLWHDGSAAQKSFFSSVLHGGNSDDCIGRADIHLSDLVGKRGTIETWYDLVHRTSHHQQIGQIRLRIQLLQLDKSETVVLPNYHAMYDELVQVVIERLVLQNIDTTTAENSFEEFGKRYGVRAVYRRLKYLSRYLQMTEGKTEIWSNQRLAAAVKNITAIFTRPDSPKMTLAEGELWSYSLRTIWSRFHAQFQSYKTVFPLAKPELELQAILTGLSLVYQSKSYLRDASAGPLEATLAADINICCNHVYDHLAAEAASSTSSKQSSSAPSSSLLRLENVHSLLDLISKLTKTLEEDLWHFAGVINPYVNLLDVCAPAYVIRLSFDMTAVLEKAATASPEQEVPKNVFDLYFAYLKFYLFCKHLTSKRNHVPPLQTSAFLPLFYQHIENMHFNLIKQIEETCQNAKLASISESQPWCQSLADLMQLLKKFADFLFSLQWQEPTEFHALMHAFLKSTRMILTHYAVSMLNAFIDLVNTQRTGPARHDSFRFQLDEQMVSALASVSQTRIEFVQFANELAEKIIQDDTAPLAHSESMASAQVGSGAFSSSVISDASATDDNTKLAELKKRITATGTSHDVDIDASLLDALLEQAENKLEQELYSPIIQYIRVMLEKYTTVPPPVLSIVPTSFFNALTHTKPLAQPAVVTTISPADDLQALFTFIDGVFRSLGLHSQQDIPALNDLRNKLSRHLCRHLMLDIKTLLIASNQETTAVVHPHLPLTNAAVRFNASLNEQQFAIIREVLRWFTEHLLTSESASESTAPSTHRDLAWIQQLCAWADMPSKKLISLLFEKTSQENEEFEVLILAVLRSRSSDPMVSQFLNEHEEDKRRKERWNQVAPSS